MSKFKLLFGAFAVGTTASVLTFPDLSRRTFKDAKPLMYQQPMTRDQSLSKLRGTSMDDPLDLLVVGGGATGAGTALDAATRGMRTGLVEMEDFASGTSSRSTKLIHGGVRYLEKAVFQLDLQQLGLVFEALKERAVLVHQAPHLCQPIPTMLPCYKWWEMPWYLAGLKMYDLVAVAGRGTLDLSRAMTSSTTKELFPVLRSSNENGSLYGSIVYYDGQMDDARLCLSAALTASCYGAPVANYCKVTAIESTKDDAIKKVSVEDRLKGKKFSIYTRAVVNATGPYSDKLRAVTDNSKGGQGVTPSRGSHITLPAHFSAPDHAMLIPKTSDGRVVFLIRWLDHTIAGTTDVASSIDEKLIPSSDEVEFILESIKPYVGQVTRDDVLSVWAGLRPLAVDPNATSTQEVVREHFINVNKDSRVVSVTGGKWTTYRKMAQDVVDSIEQNFPELKTSRRCVTEDLLLIGAQKFKATIPPRVGDKQLTDEVWNHLQNSYGDRAEAVLKIAEAKGEKGFMRLAKDLPVIAAEVEYCAKYEMCETVDDFVRNRTRMAFLNAPSTAEAIPTIAALLKEHKSLPRSAVKDAQDSIKNFFV